MILFSFALVSGGFGLAAAADAATDGASETWVGQEISQKAVFYKVLSTLERSRSKYGLRLGAAD